MIFTILSLAEQKTNWKNSKAFLITHDGLLLGCSQLSHSFLPSQLFLDPEAPAHWARESTLCGNFWLGRGSQPKENKITDNYAWFTRATQIQKETRGAPTQEMENFSVSLPYIIHKCEPGKHKRKIKKTKQNKTKNTGFIGSIPPRLSENPWAAPAHPTFLMVALYMCRSLSK